MNKSKVAILRCDTYDEEQVYEAVKKGVDLIGGISSFVSPGETIVLKPNVLFGTDPQKCVTTHPSVFKAAGKLIMNTKATVYYGDGGSRIWMNCPGQFSWLIPRGKK